MKPGAHANPQRVALFGAPPQGPIVKHSANETQTLLQKAQGGDEGALELLLVVARKYLSRLARACMRARSEPPRLMDSVSVFSPRAPAG